MIQLLHADLHFKLRTAVQRLSQLNGWKLTLLVFSYDLLFTNRISKTWNIIQSLNICMNCNGKSGLQIRIFPSIVCCMLSCLRFQGEIQSTAIGTERKNCCWDQLTFRPLLTRLGLTVVCVPLSVVTTRNSTFAGALHCCFVFMISLVQTVSGIL
jgi:hypothetical protein